jgi:hypothetical protein
MAERKVDGGTMGVLRETTPVAFIFGHSNQLCDFWRRVAIA